MAAPKYTLGSHDKNSIKQQVVVGIVASILAILVDNQAQIVEYVNTQLVPSLNSNGTVGGALLAVVLMVVVKAVMKYGTDTRFTKEELDELLKNPRPRNGNDPPPTSE